MILLQSAIAAIQSFNKTAAIQLFVESATGVRRSISMSKGSFAKVTANSSGWHGSSLLPKSLGNQRLGDVEGHEHGSDGEDLVTASFAGNHAAVEIPCPIGR
jgi:hypothetical protein